MSESNVPAVRSIEEQQRSITAIGSRDLTPQQVAILKNTVAKGVSDDELKLFIAVCGKTGLDPFTKQIHAVKRWDAKAGSEVMSIQTGIDGYRLIAQRSGEYRGQVGPWWCGKDGVWRDLWTSDEPPFAARVGVMRENFEQPVYAIARWSAYVQTAKGGGPNRMWTQMGPEQLAKCAEALALRKCFPNELSGLYTREEMGQAENADADLGRPLPAHPAPREREQARRREAATVPAAAKALEVAAEAIVEEAEGAGGDKEAADKDATPAQPTFSEPVATGTWGAKPEDAPAPEDDAVADEPPADEPPAVLVPTAADLKALGDKAHIAYKKKRVIMKESPIGSGRWWLTDTEALRRAELPTNNGAGFHRMTDEQRTAVADVLLDLIREAEAKR